MSDKRPGLLNPEKRGDDVCVITREATRSSPVSFPTRQSREQESTSFRWIPVSIPVMS